MHQADAEAMWFQARSGNTFGGYGQGRQYLGHQKWPGKPVACGVEIEGIREEVLCCADMTFLFARNPKKSPPTLLIPPERVYNRVHCGHLQTARNTENEHSCRKKWGRIM